MTTKIVTIFKYIAIISIIISTTSCETDFENVGGDLVDNGVFNTKKESFKLTAYTKNLEASRVDNISTAALTSLKMPLGVYNNDDFGLFKSNVIAQITPPSSLDWGTDSILDAVYLEIPYDATSIRESGDDKPKFELNNIFGDKSANYQITVKRLDTYLSKLDATDPSKPNKYYSDKVFNTSDELYPLTNFHPSENDTVAYYDRTLINGLTTIQAQDTIKVTDAKPYIRIKLDKTFFKTNFIDNADQTVFDNRDDFNNFFKGIVIQAEGTDGSVMMLDYALAKINFYMSSNETTDQTEFSANADLNNDGTIDDATVTTTYPVRDKKVITFGLSGIKTNHFERDYSMANGFTQITAPNTVDGEKKLYVQGAAGSIAVIDLFSGENLAQLRNKNWLINEANLTFYVDNQNETDVPNRLLLYKLGVDGVSDDEQILDAITSPDYFNGFLQKDGDTPTKYKVNITDYISEVLKKEDFTEPVKLGLKVYNGLDTPASAQDIKVKDYSWNPQNVVLFGNDYQDTDADYSKRLKLEVYYTELNN